jgi:hypothetical protein
MGVEMVITCSRKGLRTIFTPELGLRLWGDRKKAAKSTGFLAPLSQFFICSVKAATRWGDHAPPIPANTNVTVDSAAAGSRGPRGGVWSAPTGSSAVAENACAGAVLVAASALPGRIPAPWPGTPARGVRPVIGGAAVLAGGVFRRGG